MKRSSRLLFLFISFAWLAGCEKSIEEELEALGEERQAFGARLAEIEDEALRGDLQGLARTYFLVRKIRLENSKPPEETGYGEPPFALLGDYADIAEMTESFLGGLIANNEPSNFSNEDIDVLRPFALPFAHELTWDEVVLADGAVIPIREERDPEATEVHAAAYGEDLYVYYPEGIEKSLPRRLRGRFAASLPRDLLRFDFADKTSGSPDQAGEQAGEQAGYEATLVAREGHFATVEIRRLDGAALEIEGDDLILAARDEAGRSLDDKGNTTGPAELVEVFGSALERALEAALGGGAEREAIKADFEREMEAFGEKHAGTYRKTTFFRGQVAALEVFLVDRAQAEAVERDLDLPLQALKDPREANTPLRDIAPQAVVYDYNLGFLEDGMAPELRPEEVQAAIKVEQRPYYGSKPGELRFAYPEVMSDLFLGSAFRFGDIENLTFHDADGQPVTPAAGAEAAYSVNLTRIEYEGKKFSAPPVRVTGSLPVRILPELKQSRLERGALPDGIEIEGNRVIVTSEDYRQEALIYARAADGRFLKEITAIDYRYDDAATKRVYYYYGAPQAVELLERGRSETVDYAFDVKLE